MGRKNKTGAEGKTSRKKKIDAEEKIISKRKRGRILTLVFAVFILSGLMVVPGYGKNASQAEKTKQRTEAEKELDACLKAKSAVLLDMDSGRVLYEKNGDQILPMASTTKIMTCILALEEGELKDVIEVSDYAAGQPKVHLGMEKGMQYQLQDLLYSLMLESHNDSAVAIAEYIGSRALKMPQSAQRTKEQSREAVKVFCDNMTKKARELGCENTIFLTPNGLDAEAVNELGERIVHSTTAADLARIMRYCVTQSEEKEKFLEITRTASYSFADQEKKRSYSCINHNALLTMLEGALSGKTGFTSQAGYCYVGALKKDGKQFALALLACGWPGHKSWKWQDCRKLFSYGMKNYEYREFSPKPVFPEIMVKEGVTENADPWSQVMLQPQRKQENTKLRILSSAGEEVKAYVEMEKVLEAPVAAGTVIGSVSYRLEDQMGRAWEIGQEPLYVTESIMRKNYAFVFRYIWKKFLI